MMTEDVVALLPRLRDHARVLCGNDAYRADWLVEKALVLAIAGAGQWPDGQLTLEDWLVGLVRRAHEQDQRPGSRLSLAVGRRRRITITMNAPRSL